MKYIVASNKSILYMHKFMNKMNNVALGCLESGKKFKIQIAGEKISVPTGATFNIEHEREGKNEEVEFQFKWKRGSDLS